MIKQQFPLGSIALFLLIGVGLFYTYYTPRSAPPEGPMGLIGVSISSQHAGIRAAFTQVNTTVKKIIREELDRVAPGCPFDIGALYKTRNRCHTTVAYLGNQDNERMSRIQHAIVRWHQNNPLKRGTFDLSESLAFFGPQDSTIVLLINDTDDCLHNLHTGLERCLSALGPEWYVPWRTIGAFIPHITIGKIDFTTVRTIARQNGHSENLLVDTIVKRIRTELFARFTLSHDIRTIECKTFTLFSPKRDIVALCSLS